MEQGRRAHRPPQRPGAGQARPAARPHALLTRSLDRALLLAYRGHTDRARRAFDGASDWSRWLEAYVALSRGDFATADRHAAAAATSSDPAVRCAALITLGSSARQAGRHGEGRIHDAAALQAATTPTQRTHALIGLAADAVGLGDARTCAARLAEAAAAMPPGDRRARVRLSWVRCEHALLAGEPPTAVTHAREAVRHARGLRSRRHRAKSLLFLGVALEAAGSPRATRVLRRALRLSEGRRGFEPIAAVARDVLARATGGTRLAG